MEFREAFSMMKNGAKVKLPEWSGYWAWEDNTIKLHCKDGVVMDIRETEDVDYTFSFITRKDWQPILEDYEIPTTYVSNFGEALRQVKLGTAYKRRCWGNEYIYLVKPEIFAAFSESFLAKVSISEDLKERKILPWTPSQEDLLACDWHEYGLVENKPKVLNSYIYTVATNLLKRLGFTASTCGFEYIRDAIMISFATPLSISSISKNIYIPLAERYSTTNSRIEKGIRTAIAKAWPRADLELQEKVFSYTVNSFSGVPTNSEFVAIVSDYMRISYRE